MPHNFDEELPEDLSFVAGGKTYTMILAPPGVLAKMEDADDPETAEEATTRTIEKIAALLQPEDAKQFMEAATLENGGLPYRTIQSIWEYAWATQTGRPTDTPSRSAPGRGGTGATSTADSVSAATAARQAARAKGRR